MAKIDKHSLSQVAEVELIYRNKVKPADRLKVSRSNIAYDILMSVWDMNKIELVEQFYILFLDRANHCLGFSHAFTGGVSYCPVDNKIVFAKALKARASSIIVAHNHPSGTLKPSDLDIALTLQLHEGCRLLGMELDDSLIVTPYDYYSFGDNDLLPEPDKPKKKTGPKF